MNEWYAYDKLCETRYSIGQIRHRLSIAERELKGTDFGNKASIIYDDLEELADKLEHLINGLYKNLLKGEEEK